MNFEDLGLSAELLRAVQDQGYTTPTPIQAQAIPLILAGRDMFGGAQTGTGKTAAFTLPLLQRLGAGERPNGRRRVRALVLTPTRELAAQVQDSIRTYGKRLPFSSTVVFGGVNIGRQKDQLARGVDILVATPGRLLDLVGQRCVDLGGVEILVLDEADRMLDMGFIHDIRKILALLPAERQNLLFSATYSPEIRKLASAFMHDPASVDVAPRNTTAEKVGQVAYLTRREGKREVLSKLIREGDWKQVLVFTRTKHGANRLSTQLENDGIQASAIHGNKSQAARTRALSDFKRGKVRVLVATDIAARGLDIELLPHVVNYEIPNVPEDYVHRIGRTGRAGAVGEAVSLVCVDERKLLWDIEKLLGGEIEKRVMEGHEPDPKETPRPIPGMGKPGGGGRGQGRPNNRPQNNGRGQRQGAGGRSGPTHGRPGGGRPGGRPAGRPSGSRPSGRQRTGR